MKNEVMYSAYVSRQMTYGEPSEVAVYIMEAKVAGFEIDGRQMLRQSNGSYLPNDGTWFRNRSDAVQMAIKILEERMASFAKKIAEFRKEVGEDVVH